ncbi:MAG: hypothetical protein ACJAYU_003638 [Bradymonadia bacterium]|jgi:hypothetical protein
MNSAGSFECECAVGFDGDGFVCTPVSVYSFLFPTAGDAIFGDVDGEIASNDGYTGSRETPLATVSRVDVSLALTMNGLTSEGAGFTCLGVNGYLISLNGQAATEEFWGGQEEMTHTGTADFDPPVAGPEYDIEIRITYNLCGPIIVDETASTMTLLP